MEEEREVFRFLGDEEFLKLSASEKAVYLALAAQELELRQRKLREHMEQLRRETKPED